MPRWDPGTQQRLTDAALDLFLEHGYEAVTVAQIAERAGITRRSFFRYFPDKREVLFAGSEALPAALSEAMKASARIDGSLASILEALSPVAEQLTRHLDRSRSRRVVIDASPELQERERTKLASATAAIADQLEARGVEGRQAALSAQLATIALQDAFVRWIEAEGSAPFSRCLDEAADSLRRTAGPAVTAVVDQVPPTGSA